MRLIDADHLRKWILTNWHNTTLYDILDQIDREDTYIEGADIVDAEPIRHGHWIEVSPQESYKCSVCSLINDWEDIYCPNCGAKMDEEVEE